MDSKLIGLPEWDDDFYEDSLICYKCKKEISMDDLREHIKNHDVKWKTLSWYEIFNFYREHWDI